MSNARTYRRDWNYRNKYGLTIEEVRDMFDEQGGCCGICGRALHWEAPGQGNIHRTCVDHCHQTGIVRGILCWTCNAGIGKFNDDPELIERALAWVTSE